MADGLQPEMQGSPNPLIIRNYRMIPPQTWKYFNLSSDPTAFPGQHLQDQDIPLIFKVEAAPIVLPYESELILTFTFARSIENDTLKGMITNQWTPKPIYRVKAKSMAHIVKRCWATISNMTFQSYRQPFYLNEILLRKPHHNQEKYPDNYTGEKVGFFQQGPVDYQNELTGPMIGGDFKLCLEPLSRSCPNEGQLYFMTPQISFITKTISGQPYYLTNLSFRIPLTELLPVFKIGVIPLIMIAANSFDLWIDLYKPADWFVNYGIGDVVALETYLNISTVSFPDINPLAETLIRPRIYDGRFIAPFLDYLVFENTCNLNQTNTTFYFNITQSLRNVPFIALSFSPMDASIENEAQELITIGEPYITDTAAKAIRRTNQGTFTSIVHPSQPNFVTGEPRITTISVEQANRGGFFTLPPNVTCKDLKIMLGESAFPLTQVPMSWEDMYMYNRKHFEMYGRDFNVYRVSPIGRAYSGDASFFFDLSHAPMTGFQIGPASPLQLIGTLVNGDVNNEGATISHTIRVTLTCYYSNNFNTMLASGGVVPLQ